MRFHFLDADPERRRAARAHRDRDAARRHDASPRSPSRRSPRRSAALLLGTRAARRDPRRRARAVGVHEPRARLRAAAGGGARAGVRDRLADQRRASPSSLTVCLVVVRDQGALGLLLGNYVASRGGADRPVVGRARRVRAPPGGSSAPSSARCCASGCRPSPPRSRSSRCSSSTASGSTASRAPDEAGLYSLSVKLAGDRRLHGARVPVRVAAARLLDRRGRPEASRVYARITTYYVLFTGVVVAGLVAARPLARAAVRRAGVLRGPRGAAVGRARLGAVRPVPRAGGDGRAAPRSRSATRPPRSAGLIVNVALLALLVPPLGIAGAGLALVGRLRRDARS